jgi:O-antigen/teichoic acid export membrane protein/thymidylate kinase
MNSESNITAAGTAPLSVAQVRAPESQPDPRGFAGTLFHLMEELDLRYCLLHAPDPETDDSPSGVELTIHPEDRDRLPSLIQNLRKEGYLPIQRVPLAANDCRYDFASSMDADTCFFSVTIREVFPSGHLKARDGEILARRQKQGDFWVLCEADEFCYLLSKISLEGKIRESEQNRLKQLAEILGPSLVRTVAAGLFGDALQLAVTAAGVDGQWNKVQQRLRNQLWRANFRSAPIDWFKYWLLQFRCTLQRWLHPSGMFIVILGPDGAGKSTLTQRILELLGPLFASDKVLQWRPQFLKPRPRYFPGFNPPHTKPPHGLIESVARVFAVLLDYWVAYPTVIRPLLARVALVIYDRDFHDLLVDRLRYRYGGPDWLPGLAAKLLPRPGTLYLTLDADPDVIQRRKNEVAPDELRRQLGAYRDLAGRLPSSTLIRTDEGLEASTSAATRAVLTYMASRFAHRQRRLLTRAVRKTKAYRASSPTVPSNGCGIRESRSLRNSLVNFSAGLGSWVFKGGLAIADQGLISGSNFVLSIFLARYLGADQYGAYALAFSTFVLLSLIHQALVLEPMSVFGPSVYRNSLRHYLGLMMWLQLGMGAIFVIAASSVGVLSSFLREPSHLAMAFAGMAFAAPCVLLLWFARRAFYLQLRPGQALIGAFAYSALLWFGIWALGRAKLLSLFATFLVMGSCALLTSILLLIRLQPAVGVRGTAAWLALKEVSERHWRYGVWALVSGLLFWIPWNIFYPLVARFSGLAEAGTLRALLNLTLPITSAYSAFSMLFLPHTALLGHEGGWESVKAQAWRIAGLYVLGSGSYWLLVCLFRSQLIHFLYADQYSQVVPLVPVLAISSILSGATLGPTIAIRAMRSPATVALIYFGASVVALLVGIPACRAWGFRGAILAILLSSMMAFLAGFQILRSRDRQPVPDTKQIAPVDQPIETNAETR